MDSFQHMAVFLCLSPIIDFILFSCSFLFQVDLLLLMCEAQWFWNCIMYHGPWYHGLVLLCLVLTPFWYSQQHGCLRSFWRVLFYGFLFVVPLFLVAPICSFRTMQPHGLGAPRVSTVGAVAQRQCIMWIYTIIYNVYTIQYSGALPQRNEQWRQKRERETDAVWGQKEHHKQNIGLHSVYY